ncbi:hypothetical protein V5799_027379, partial [Amblyomma americanum]
MNVPEGTPMETTLSAVELARCLPPGKLRQEYLVLLELVGHGRFQHKVLFCAHLSLAMVLFHYWSAHVLTQPVDHWCKPPALFAHLTREQWLNVSIPVVEDGQGNRHHSRCTMYDLATIVFNGSRVEVPCDGWDYDLPDDTHTLISKWNLVCDREQYLVQTFAYYTVSGVLVPPLLGQMADRVGRRPVIFTGLLVAMGSVFVATAADSFTTFVLANLLIAISGEAVHIMTSILLFESSSSASRTLYIVAAQTAAVLVHAGSLCPWLQRVDLRLLRITLVMSMVLLSLTFHAVSESPRWLLAMGKYDTLTAVIARLACENGVALGDVWRLVHYAEAVKPLQVGKPFRISDVLLLSELRVRTAALSVVWFWCFLARFSLSQVRPSAFSGWDQLLLALLMLPVYATGYPLVIKWNRLTSLYMAFAVASTAAAGAGLVMFYDCLMAAQCSRAIVQVLMEVLFAVVQLCLLISKLQAYECFPSAVRATGVTMLVAAGRLGQSVGEMLVDIARLPDFWSTLLIIATGLLACQLAIRWLPETKDVELPEVQREVLAQGQQSPPKEPSMARHIESCAPSVSHHDSTADNCAAAKRTHSEG